MSNYPTTPLPAAAAPAHGTATDKQLKFIGDLMAERIDPNTEIGAKFCHRYGQLAGNGELSKSKASEIITWLLDRPKLAPAAPTATAPAGRITAAQVPAGHYAVNNADGELRFYNVWWAPNRDDYFKLYVEHGPDDSEVPFKTALAILKKIAEDPRAAALRYGREIGACSKCGRRLTNRISRMLDIGPVCGGRFYADDEWSARKATAREALLAAGLDPKADVEDADDIAAIREAAGL